MPIYDPDTFNPDIAIGYLAKRIVRASLVRMEPAFAGENIGYQQWAALVSIWAGRGSTCRALARDLGHDKGATTRLLDGLEQRGYVARERDDEDRRVINLVLTDEGHAIAERVMRRVVTYWNGWLADWSQEDATRLIGFMQRLRKTIEADLEDGSCD